MEVARRALALGYELVATHGTAAVIADAGLKVKGVNKVAEGRPHIVDMLKNDEIQVVFNTTEGKQAIADSSTIRRTALRHSVFCTTTIAGRWQFVMRWNSAITCRFIPCRTCMQTSINHGPYRATEQPLTHSHVDNESSMTVKGAEALRDELNELKSVARPKITKRLLRQESTAT